MSRGREPRRCKDSRLSICREALIFCGTQRGRIRRNLQNCGLGHYTHMRTIQDIKPTWDQRLGAIGLLLCKDVAEVGRERCPPSAGSAIPAVCAEIKAFEASHEKCQNMQWISLNHRGLKSAQVILRGHSLPLPGRRNRAVALALIKPHLLWQDSVTSLRRSVWLLERRGLTRSLLVLRAEAAMSLNRFEGRRQMLLVHVFAQVALPRWINSLHQTMLVQREMINSYWGDPGNKWDRVWIVIVHG